MFIGCAFSFFFLLTCTYPVTIIRDREVNRSKSVLVEVLLVSRFVRQKPQFLIAELKNTVLPNFSDILHDM